MKPGRRPHWRENAAQQTATARTFHRSKLFRAIRAAARLLEVLAGVRPSCSEEAAARLACRAALDEALPYLADEEGRVSL